MSKYFISKYKTHIFKVSFEDLFSLMKVNKNKDLYLRRQTRSLQPTQAVTIRTHEH